MLIQEKVDSREGFSQYKPNKRAEEVLALIKEDWQDAYNQKQRTQDFLRYRKISDMWEESRRHFNGIPWQKDEDDPTQNWRSNYFRKKTRHKVIATVAQFIDSGVGIDFSALKKGNQLNIAMAQVAEDLYEWSLAREDWTYKQLTLILEAVITGTCHIYEELAWDEREVKDILDIDFETMEVKWKKNQRVDFKGPRAQIIPNDEIFPGDQWEPTVENQPYMVWRTTTSYQNAMSALSKYENFKYVVPGTNNFLPITDEKGNQIKWDSNNQQTVEIVRYFVKQDDLMLIVCNGVLLTPVDNPIPYHHKSYPIRKLKFEDFADTQYYWGDSMPNKNWDEQEIQNKLWNTMLDSSYLKQRPPIITDVPELANTDIVIPGVTVAYDGDFKTETIRELVQGPSNSEFNMLKESEAQSNENTLPSISSGVAPQGSPTATEINYLAGSAERLKGYNLSYYGHFLIEHAKLRVPNLLWFVTEDEDFQKIVIDDVKTSKGRNGQRKISFVKAVELPTADQIYEIEEYLSRQGQEVDFVFVNGESVNDYQFHFEMSAQPKPRRNSAQKLIKEFQKYQFYSTNQLIDQEQNTRNIVRALGDSPEEIMKAIPNEVPDQIKLPANAANVAMKQVAQPPNPVAGQPMPVA